MFTPTVPITAFVRLYQGGKDAPGAVQVRTRIVDAATQVFEDVTTLDAARFQAGRSSDYRLELPLARLREGEQLADT